MPLTYVTQAFLAGPRAFFDNNLVLPFAQGMVAGLNTMSVVLSPNKTCKRLGAAIPVNTVIPAPGAAAAADTFQAYWCPYAQNQTLTCQLGNAALFMITDVMDGCSFGVGTQAGGACMVSHSNAGGAGAAVDNAGFGVDQARRAQAAVQADKIKDVLHEYTPAVIAPASYMADADGARVLKSTTFGIHAVGGAWSFYTQKYWYNQPDPFLPGTYFLRDTVQQI